jgi:hypothetical protein
MKEKIVGTILLGLSVCAGLCESPQQANPGPVQAELLAPLNVRRLTNGAIVLARVTLDWKGPDCTLRTGSILEATVEAADLHKGRSESKLALSFTRAQCNGTELQPEKLLLAAVSQPPADWRTVPNAEFRTSMSFLLANGKQGAGFGGMVINNFSAPTLELTGIEHRFPMSPKVKPGDVLEIKGMKLEIGTGPKQSSILTTKGRDVTLDKFTQFLLVPASLVLAPTSLVSSDTPAMTSSGEAHSSRPAPVPVNDLEVCAPPACAVDRPVTENEVAVHNAASIGIQPLGYAPRPREVLGDFGDEESLVWLSSRHLLLTFNSHPLIHRSGINDSSTPHRVIRAVVLDAESHAIVRTMDWEITDSHRYLWPLDRNRILVHVGNELRIYGAGLEVERSLPLAAPLAFVRIAPNGELLAVATLHERHSTELHAKLRDNLGEEPEEDVDVAILDNGFNPIAQAATRSGLQPPTLLNEGQVKLLSQPNMQFRLALKTWDNKTVTLARFASRCTPELSSLAPDLLFLLSCDTATGAVSYRVLRADGKLLLRGEAGPREVGHGLTGNQEKERFALKVVHAVRELSPGIEFKRTELESEEVRVYRANDGKRLLAVRVNAPVASHDSYALSSDGTQLAVLSGSEIKFFAVPSE